MRPTQVGILTMTQHRQAATNRSTMPPVEEIPRLAGPPEARKTRRAVTRTRDWATWTASVPGKGPPPQPGQALGLGEGVADERDGCGHDQEDDEGQADDVGGEHDDGQHGHDAAQQHDEDPAPGHGPEDELAEHHGGLGRVDALAEDGLGQRVRRRDGHAGEAQAGVGRDGGDHDPGGNVFQGGPGLDRLVTHDDGSADQDEEDQEGIGDAFGHAPQLAHPALVGHVRGGEQGMAEHVQHRVEGRGHQIGEPAVDGRFDVAGDVEEAR